ncbi:type I-E CRISPR-associated protein Cas7/Cse4/CasC [Nocardioides immobilis]|uniref:Type I-E CRISPR-associated protein Cas7/Cse4/CasC n=1 Tax=Nocardioides immobilis TaxID=2049295 RepID=A0A417XZQ1_9ACTN|nr:type I-E CRISPR-associated protein Cas7/Cse4/CasC [Nocardioides immobilis]RHW25831.1 type I-E CRISPR-associated protein Cas7/Cse4/CasC [Nocardioides immobilis]
MTTFIDIHVLQTVPSSNLNRDDTGSPKTAIFGGVRRARVSSQAWKHATRRDFAAYLPESDRGLRTRRIMEDLTGRISALDASLSTDEALQLAKDVMSAANPNITFKEPRPKKPAKGEDAAPVDPFGLSDYLIFISNQQLDRLAELAVDGRAGELDKRAAKEVLKQDNGIEVALFGRMVADDKSISVDASVQVAHAISTHPVETEYDYFTAVDDANAETDPGAGMIGVIEFNSSTLYRYATINLDQLQKNLGDTDVAKRAAEAFVRSFSVSMPSGKQNTFANGTLPDAVVVQVRHRRPVNLVGAFEAPIRPDGKAALSVLSAEALAKEAREVDAAYGTPPTSTYVMAVKSEVAAALGDTGEHIGFEQLIDRVGDRVLEALRGTA